MKKLKTLFLIALSSLFLSACASSTPSELDEKYIFPELEQVDHIRSYKIDGWGEIDKQSLFVSVSPSTSYLIILKRPNNDMRFAHGISFDTSSSTIYAKFDKIKFHNIQDNLEPLPAFIERIYEVKGKDQKKMIRAQIKDEVLASDPEEEVEEMNSDAE